MLKNLKNLKTDRDLHLLRQGFQKKIGDLLKGNLKRIQKENRTLKRVRKEKKDSIYFPEKVTRFTMKVSNCFENSSIGCTTLFPRIIFILGDSYFNLLLKNLHESIDHSIDYQKGLLSLRGMFRHHYAE